MDHVTTERDSEQRDGFAPDLTNARCFFCIQASSVSLCKQDKSAEARSHGKGEPGNAINKAVRIGKHREKKHLLSLDDSVVRE